jgi:hypothetical protein
MYLSKTELNDERADFNLKELKSFDDQKFHSKNPLFFHGIILRFEV